MIEVVSQVINKFLSGNVRSVKARRNIIASIGIKGASIIIGFLLVPLVINYLDQTRYGVWLTLTSFLAWFSFFDIGLGNGLRNKLAEAIANNDFELGRVYVSTTYFILTVIISVIAVLFFIANHFINWSRILNIDPSTQIELSKLATIVFGLFFLNFIFNNIGKILLADQRTAASNLFGPLSNLLSLIVIYILTKTTSGSLLYLGLVMSISPVLILIIASVYLFHKDYTHLRPSLKYIRFKYSRDLFSLGAKFFIVQIAGLVMYQSTNIIISQYFGPAEVTPYNLAYKYFSLVYMLFTLILYPYWSAFTEAWVKDDIIWIKSTVNGMLKIWSVLSVLTILLLIISRRFYIIWIGKEIIIPFQLSFFMALFFITFMFGGIFNMFINGVGKIKLQLYLSLISSIIFIFVSIGLIKVFKFGISSLVLASIIGNIEGFVIAPIQYYKIVNKKAVGIWNA